MIISTTRRKIILCTTKTGTQTLRKIVTDNTETMQAEIIPGHHRTYQEIKQLYPNITDMDQWDVYAFYRDPVDRFLSAMAWTYGVNPSLDTAMTVAEFIGNVAYAPPQTRWINSKPNIILFNFAEYQQSITTLCSIFGLVDPTIYHLNATTTVPYRKTVDMLTAEEIGMIKDLYSEDYQFFEQKNITVPSA